MNENEQLGYISSSPLLVATENVKPIDEAELSTLEAAFKLLEDRKAFYESVSSLNLTDSVFRVEQQLAVNKKVLFHIQELETLLASTINNIREKQANGRDY